MNKFQVTCTSKGVTTSFIMLEKDYQTLWLKIDSLGLTNIKVESL